MIYTNWKAAELKKLILVVTCLVVFFSAVSASFATQFAVGYNLRISENLNVLQNPDSAAAQMMAAWTTPTALANQRNHPYSAVGEYGNDRQSWKWQCSAHHL